MTLKEAREEILRRHTELMEKDATGTKFVCPNCKVGLGEDEEGLKTEDNAHYTCPLGCFEGLDIFGILTISVGTNNETNLIKAASNELNIELELEQDKAKTQAKEVRKRSKDSDFELFYIESAEEIYMCKYLQNNGISRRVQNQFKIGYCEDWIHPSTKAEMEQYIKATPRIIIPMTNLSYAAIYTGDENNIARVQRVGEDTVFNREALYEGTSPLFVFENEIDALSVIECGYDAVSFGSLKHLDALFKLLEENRTSRLLIVSIYNDPNNPDLEQYKLNINNKLKELDIEFILFDVSKGEGTVNDILRNSIEGMNESILEGLEKAKEYELDNIKEFLKENNNIKFLEQFYKKANTAAISTSIEQLDRVLNGGLYDGLYTIYGDSSMGKTTLALQIADSVASQSIDVLYFSMGTSRKELIAKSISRLTACISAEQYGELTQGMTARNILVNTMNFENLQKRIVDGAFESYKQYSYNIRVYECDSVNVNDIKGMIEDYVQHTQKAGRKMVVIVDSIQGLADFDEKNRTNEDHQNLNMMKLKRISREYNMPIIAISNEKNGRIENASDVIIGLNTLDNDIVKKLKVVKTSPKGIVLSIEKNKNGVFGEIVELVYFPDYNVFKARNQLEEDGFVKQQQ